MSDRLHGLDLIRLVSFFAIATFHVSLIHYYTPAIDIAEQSIVIKATEQISRVLAFSGFTICFLSSLLTAFSGSSLKKRLRLFLFLIIGWAAFSALMSTPDDTWLVWDIYPLIFTGILLATAIQMKSEQLLRIFGIAGFCILWIPFWQFRSFVSLPSDLQIALGFGECPNQVVEWPVFPWIGLVFFGYWLGNEARNKWRSGDRGVFRIEKKEAALWGVVLAASTLEFGNFYGVKLGEAFACEAYRQPPLIWWSHFVWPMALVRASFDPRVQGWLGRWRLSHFVSSLAISRKFWLAYFANYLFCYVLSMLVTWSEVEQTQWNSTVIAFIAVFLVPMTEILTRGLLGIARVGSTLFKHFKGPAGLNPVKSQRGASLMVAMIIAAVIGAVVGGITLLVRNRSDARMLRNALDGRAFAFEQVRQSAGSPDALRVTALTDPSLSRCIHGPTCTVTNPAAARQLILMVPYSAGAAPVPVTSANGSTATSRFNWRGLSCDAAKPDTCFYYATATWWAECPNKVAGATCPSFPPHNLKIYVIPQIRNFRLPGKKTKAAMAAEKVDLPTAKQIQAEKALIAKNKQPLFAMMTMSNDIRGASQQQCPLGSYMTGTREDGMITCECEQGYVKDGVSTSTGWPTCTPLTKCPGKQIMRGVYPNGAPDCYEPVGTSYDCESHSTPSNGVVRCAPGQRMREVTSQDECYIKNIPGVGDAVECGAMTIKCCSVKK